MVVRQLLREISVVFAWRQCVVSGLCLYAYSQLVVRCCAALIVNLFCIAFGVGYILQFINAKTPLASQGTAEDAYLIQIWTEPGKFIFLKNQ